MLKGWIGETSLAPYLEGRLVIPRLHINSPIAFLVDTGADESLIMPSDGIAIGIDYTKLKPSLLYLGIGGSVRIHTEQAFMAFSEPLSTFIYDVKVGISELNPDLMGAPSLLGRDILNRWKMIYDSTKNIVTFTVRSADFIHKR
jgi:hypothetical protein